MVNGEVINISSILEALSPALAEKLAPLIIILKAIGIAFLVYVAYLVVNAFFVWRNRKRIKGIENKITEINEKLDKILKNIKGKKTISKK